MSAAGFSSLERQCRLLGFERFRDVAGRPRGNRQVVIEARVADPRHRLAVDRDGFRGTARIFERAPIRRLEHRRVGKAAREIFE